MVTDIYKKNECVIHVDKSLSEPVSAWVDNGQTAFYIKQSEKDMFKYDPERALMFMSHMVNRGIRRCSRCGWEGKKEEFRHGHMAELLCIACCADDAETYKKDIQTGNICRICGQPRSRCCC